VCALGVEWWMSWVSDCAFQVVACVSSEYALCFEGCVAHQVAVAYSLVAAPSACTTSLWGCASSLVGVA
jgi:hypothetical protein